MYLAVSMKGLDEVAVVRHAVLLSVLVFLLLPPAAGAQSHTDCGTAERSIGAAIGGSSPYFEPSAGVGGLSRGGLYLAGRFDAPMAGAWRTRVEGSTSSWHLERQIYSADLRDVIATENIGDLRVRQIVASVGRQGGRAPACAYVLAGGGLYSLAYKGASFYSPGLALTAGIEFPGGPRAAIQVDIELHMINTRSHYPVGSSTTLGASLAAAWAYRF